MQIRTVKVADFGGVSYAEPIAQQISLPCEPWENPSPRTSYQRRPEFWSLVEKVKRRLTETPTEAAVIAKSMRARSSDVSRALYCLAEQREAVREMSKTDRAILYRSA